jgi:uncharacterized protein YhbP (UPF0306 family)
MSLSVRLESDDAPSDVLAKSVVDILDATRLLGLATISNDGGPSVCNAYFAYDSKCHLYILTPPSSWHVRNLIKDERVAALVADSQQTGDGGKQGLQISGIARRASGKELIRGLAIYRERFPATWEILASEATLESSGRASRIYVIVPKKIKIFDEKRFGAERWIETVVSGVVESNGDI